MKRIFLCCSLAIINCYASTVIHRSKFAQARASIPPPDVEIIEPPMPTGDEDYGIGAFEEEQYRRHSIPDDVMPGSSIYSQPPRYWQCE